jgi:predicted RNA binding protein YcfA (HicA-like mRNA interferase family)
MGQLGSIHWKKFEKYLLSVGCVFEREKGDHRIYWKNGIPRPIVIPRDRSLPPFIIMNNLRVLGISKDEFLEALTEL